MTTQPLEEGIVENRLKTAVSFKLCKTLKTKKRRILVYSLLSYNAAIGLTFF